MSNNKAILLLGTNLNNKILNLENAKTFILKEIGDIISLSEITETEPADFQSENMFLNQLLTVETTLSPIELLNSIKSIESKMGRIYVPTEQRYQDRIIDIDILTYNCMNFNSSRLTLPHQQLNSREFVKKMMNFYLNR
jgi:2-amino-4-hydroxy-6-hydroxymethyldihydropteridine diphosphokinase